MSFEMAQMKYDVYKARLIQWAALFSAFIYYYFLTHISPQYHDSINGRVLTCVVSIIGIVVAHYPRVKLKALRLTLVLTAVTYLFLYLYLLIENDWSMLHRWSYFVVAALACCSTLYWTDFLFVAATAFLGPFVAGFFPNHIPTFELLHFHVSNLVVFLIIGYVMHMVFSYRKDLVKFGQSVAKSSQTIALGQMSSAIAHEMNTRLNAIIYQAELIKMDLQKKEISKLQIRKDLDQIIDTSSHIASVTNGLLSFARSPEEDEVTVTELKKLFVPTLDICRQNLEFYGVDFYLEPIPQVWISCRQGQLIQVFINLIMNGIDAVANTKKRKLEIHFQVLKDKVKLFFIDSGNGIPKESRNKIMQPFFTTKKDSKSSGLSLSISREYIKEHHGNLYLDPTSSQTCFVVELPTQA